MLKIEKFESANVNYRYIDVQLHNSRVILLRVTENTGQMGVNMNRGKHEVQNMLKSDPQETHQDNTTEWTDDMISHRELRTDELRDCEIRTDGTESIGLCLGRRTKVGRMFNMDL